MRNLITGLAVLAAAMVTKPIGASAAEGWMTQTSAHSVTETADRLVAAVEKAGATVFARVDHAAGAKKVGMELAPATLVIFGNPKLGTPIINANPEAGLDLPIRVLVWSKGGQTMMGAIDPDTLKDRYSLAGADEALGKMKGALTKLMGAAAAK